MEKQIYSIKEVGAILNVSTSTLRRWVRQGRFAKSVKLSVGRRGWLRSDIEEHLEKLKIQRTQSANALPFGKTWRSEAERNNCENGK